MRMIAGRTGSSDMMCVVSAVAMLLIGMVGMVTMNRMLDMLGSRPAGIPEEPEEDETPAVEARQKRRECAKPEGDRASNATACPGAFENCVLRPETREADAAADVDA